MSRIRSANFEPHTTQTTSQRSEEAVYIFAIYEWNVAHAIEKLSTGFVHEYLPAKRPMTANMIWKRFEGGERIHQP